jgi:hypothetical protein
MEYDSFQNDKKYKIYTNLAMPYFNIITIGKLCCSQILEPIVIYLPNLSFG